MVGLVKMEENLTMMDVEAEVMHPNQVADIPHNSKLVSKMFKSEEDKDRKRFIQHNKDFLSRVYPVSEHLRQVKNIDPVHHWAVGTQMVAVNIEHGDMEEVQKNKAMFDLNGGCGYILKPNLLQHAEDRTCIVQIKVLEARHISSLKPIKEAFHRPHVQVKFIGEFPQDSQTVSTLDKSSSQIDSETLNGFHPIWNKTLPPHLFSNKDFSFLEFTIVEVRFYFKNFFGVAELCR